MQAIILVIQVLKYRAENNEEKVCETEGYSYLLIFMVEMVLKKITYHLKFRKSSLDCKIKNVTNKIVKLVEDYKSCHIRQAGFGFRILSHVK